MVNGLHRGLSSTEDRHFKRNRTSQERVREGSRPSPVLKAIKAKTLTFAGIIDLLNPEYEAMDVSHYINDLRYVLINVQRPMEHVSGAGISARKNELQNREICALLDLVAERGLKLQ